MGTYTVDYMGETVDVCDRCDYVTDFCKCGED